MKKLLAALALSAVLACSATALAAEEYIMSPGDSLQIYVLGHPDISSTRSNSDSSFLVRPDGKVDFPLVGSIDTTGKTVAQFTQELKTRLSEYIVNPDITINISKLGTTRVLVLGQVRNQGMHELTKSHRVADALAAAGGFVDKSAKKNIYLIRNMKEDNIQLINMRAFLKKGDVSQNVVLNEGDVLYLTSNHKLTFGTVFSLVTSAISTWNNIDEISNRN